jgi:DNA-binding response OmpR family regulator
MAGELILVVDDEPNIVQLARLYLERAGYRVEAAGEGQAALSATKRLRPALMILDLMLPELDGLEVCRQLRAEKNRVPILMLTARDEDVDKILGLEMGADDYLTKPFNPHELVARVRAILRRGSQAPHEVQPPVHIGDLVVDPASREATVNGRKIRIRSQEFDLLLVLAEHHGLVLSRQRLLDLAWGIEYFGETRTVDVHIGQLRKKLAGGNVQIETVTGVGYKLVLES